MNILLLSKHNDFNEYDINKTKYNCIIGRNGRNSLGKYNVSVNTISKAIYPKAKNDIFV